MKLNLDEIYMKRCIELAIKGAGYVSPNPLVGCIIVYDNIIIGEGYHKQFGKEHAEVHAINNVKNNSLLAKSTLYVNLEPCSHHGKTPPCCELIVKMKIPKVVVGCKDYSKKVNGAGIVFLKQNGVEVVENVLNEECQKLNVRFFNFHQKNIPYIILKWAQTNDGFTDKKRSENKRGINWITEKETQVLVHKWRAEEDAILVGRKTIVNDNPKLTVREYKGLQPLRIIIDPDLRLDLNLKVFNQTSTTIIVNRKINKTIKNLIYLKVQSENMILNLLIYLKKINVMSLIVEGGKETINHFLKLNYWNEARVIVGNKEFKNGLKSPEIDKKYSVVQNIGKDIIYTYYND